MEILQQLAEVLEQVTGVDPAEVRSDRRLVDDLDLDSLAMVEVAVAIEDRFKLKMPNGTIGEFGTVGDVAGYLSEKGASSHVGS